MPVDALKILRGPCVIQFDGAQFYSKDDVTIEFGLETFEIMTSVHGKVDERYLNRFARVSFTPVGMFDDTGSPTSLVKKLVPYDNSTFIIGQSVMVFDDGGGNGINKPLKLIDRNGKVMLFQAAAVSKMPNLILSTTKTIFGQVQFMCVLKNDTDWSDADSFVKYGPDEGFPADSFLNSKTFTVPYTAAWGSKPAPWNAFNTQDGFEIAFDVALGTIQVDTEGTVDFTFEKLTVTATCKPVGNAVGLTPQVIDDAMQWQGVPTAVRGQSMAAIGADLVIQGSASSQPRFTLKGAALKTGNFGFGASTQRIQTHQWTGTITTPYGQLFVLDNVP